LIPASKTGIIVDKQQASRFSPFFVGIHPLRPYLSINNALIRIMLARHNADTDPYKILTFLDGNSLSASSE
jgi:hypothetical protein